jgi:hypothetical protein
LPAEVASVATASSRSACAAMRVLAGVLAGALARFSVRSAVSLAAAVG